MLRRSLVMMLLLVFCRSVVLAEPTVPGFTVETYATATAHQLSWISFDQSTGILYAGRDGSTSGEAVRVFRIGLGGTPIDEYGQTSIPDPDAVLFDASGSMSGVAGSVLVGGAVNDGTGRVSAIHPDQTVATVWESTSLINPTEMSFDSIGRFLVGDNSTGTVQVSVTGETPSVLFAIPGGPVSMAVGEADRIYTIAFGDRVLRIHEPNGDVCANPFITAPGSLFSSVVIGPGVSPWGRDAYIIDTAQGQLLRVNGVGEIIVIGTGFQMFGDLEFGPDGALYAVDNDTVSKIIRIAPVAVIPCLSAWAVAIMALLLLCVGTLLCRRAVKVGYGVRPVGWCRGMAGR